MKTHSIFPAFHLLAPASPPRRHLWRRLSALVAIAGLAAPAMGAAPTITVQPAGRVVNPGATVTLSVTATGDLPLTYQWQKFGTAIAGATGSQLVLANVKLQDAGRYAVAVSNSSGRALSRPANVAVIPNDLRALHRFPVHVMLTAALATAPRLPPPGYVPGGTIRIECQLTYPAPLTGLTWRATLPTGWSYVATRVLTPGTGEKRDAQPAAGATGTVEWRWSGVPANPYGFRFAYELRVPATATGVQSVDATARVTMTGHTATDLAVHPDPLLIPKAGVGRRWHSADTNQDGRISLVELTRVLQLFNVRNGTNRTGAYLAIPGTEDGFDGDLELDAEMVRPTGDYHSADTDFDGRLSLLEVTRLIELFNAREGTVRTGAYRAEDGSEDSFAAGP